MIGGCDTPQNGGWPGNRKGQSKGATESATHLSPTHIEQLRKHHTSRLSAGLNAPKAGRHRTFQPPPHSSNIAPNARLSARSCSSCRGLYDPCRCA